MGSDQEAMMKFKDAVISEILYFEERVLLVCDGMCNKAWGINNRPRVQLSNDEDDYEWLSDDELDKAPEDTGVYEGGHGKPIGWAHNKWCARECERSVIVRTNEDFSLPDFSKRRFNIMPSEVEK